MNFEDFQRATRNADSGAILARLTHTLEQDRQYAAWFEALKLQARYDLGLEPWSLGQSESLSSDLQRKLEDRLIEACRVVGQRMIQDGRIAEGWMYLRPVGDSQQALKMLRSIKPTDDNIEQIIEVALGHGVCPAWGFELLLSRMGTCNAITAFDSQMVNASLEDRQQAAARLVRHLYRELLHSVQQHWQRLTAAEALNEGDSTSTQGSRDLESENLADLIDGCPGLTADQNYHIDTSHLSSVVRIGRIVDEPQVQRLAWQLCRYGQHLAELFQPQGYAVFSPYYTAHQKYYEILLAEEGSDDGLAFFRQRRADLTTASQEPSVLSLEAQIEATDVLVELLMRLQRFDDAVEVLLDQLQICGEHQRSRWTALLFRCCQMGSGFAPMQHFCQQLGDAFGFGLAAFYQKYQAER